VSYEIRFDPCARKQLGAIDKPHRRRILAKIELLAEEPRPPGAVMLTGCHGVFRIRVGDYRVVYSVSDTELIVLIIELGRRGEIYR
jgi:mRNA interferase RelE/StbE